MNSGIESSNQQLNKNQVVLLDKAQIALDTLPTKDQKEVIHVFNCLEKFPNCSNYFKVRAALKYIVIFKYEDGKITVIDIINHDLIKRLFETIKGVD